LWAGTGQGLARFDGARFKTFDPTSTPALGDAQIKSLCVDPAGALWVLGQNGSIARREAGGFVAVTAANGGLNGSGHGMYSDGSKTFVVSDTQGRVFRLEGGRLVEWLSTSNAASGPFIGINVDYDGTVWVRHGNTLDWWTGERWQRVIAPDGSGDFVAMKTGPSYAGGMWISSTDGLRRLRRGVWEKRSLAYETPVPWVQAILEDRAGNVWITHGGGQLLRFDPTGRLTQSRRHNSLAGDAVKHFFEDADGNLWLAKDKGLTRLRPKARANPPRLDDHGPHVVLEEILADGNPMEHRFASSGDGAVVLPPGGRALEFRFTGVTFDEPERVQFRHRLDGFDSDWTTGARRAVTYSNLPPGRYYFRLAAGREGGSWNGREVTASITVRPHLWQTWWFRGGVALVLLGGMVLAWQRREWSRRREQARQDEFYRRLIESQETERQRIARELHDSLGQNLLLIKNRAVMGLKDNATAEKMREQLREISEASAGSVEEIRSIARALRPYQLDRLGLTKTLEDVAASVTTAGGLGIEAQVDNIDGLFMPDAEIGLYRIVQEGLNNVLKHAEAKSARLAVRRNGGSVEIELADDGRGFDDAQRDGFGLTGVRERVRLLGGALAVKSAPSQGTRLLVSIPIPSSKPPPPPGTSR
jgi:signal transduction histidine kinase/streptogramin lyase